MPASTTRTRGLFAELRSSRYAALSVLMIVVATICVAAGTWQITRYEGKHQANGELRHNAHAAASPVGDVLPVLGTEATPGEDAIEFRTVTATGRYDPDAQLLVRRQQVSDTNGYLVLTPLRVGDTVLLVVRGFVPLTTTSLRPADVPAPPSGTVTVTGRVQSSQPTADKFAELGGTARGQIDAINVPSAAARLGTPVFAGYVELNGGQPGTSGLTAIPAPDLSNPAGGAYELQNFAYIVQWYLFAVLALAAPVVMVRADRKRAVEDQAAAVAAVAALPPRPVSTALVRVSRDGSPMTTVAERLADRYGR